MRDVFAIIGAMGTALVLLLVLMLSGGDYSTPVEVPDALGLDSEIAKSLVSEAGIKPGDARKLRAGIDQPWREGSHFEAYCIEAVGEPDAAGWGSPGELEPLLATAAVAAIDGAHDALPCFPQATQVADLGWRVKLISASFVAGEVEQARVAVRDPASGDYFLVYAWRPTAAQPVARALL